MGLESGNTIKALNASWPSGTDDRSQGDDHIRLIKRTLLNCFPNITGPVTVTQDEINRGSIPKGTTLLFYMVSPPAGWARAPQTTTYAIRMVPDGWAGGSFGGNDDPVYNNRVPPHSHAGYQVDGSTGYWAPRHADCIVATRQ